MKAQARHPGEPAWWSEPGPERCGHCLHCYYVEMGYYCAECDAPVCPACVVTVLERRLVLCPGCAERAR